MSELDPVRLLAWMLIGVIASIPFGIGIAMFLDWLNKRKKKS